MRLSERLFARVDIASLVYFRIAFGAIMLKELWRLFGDGWIERNWIEPRFHFTYFGFGWVQPWSGIAMHAHLLALDMLAIFIMVGLFCRISAALFFIGFTYLFLLEQARYLNHYYFVSLVSLLMVFVPAHRAFSLDVWRRPSLRSQTAPAWSLWILRAQMGIVYFYGGLAKLNRDWLRGEPMRRWLAHRTDYPFLGPYLTEEWAVWFFAYGGLLFDLLVVPGLLWRRTRIIAFVSAVFFHLMNGWLFNVGVFPWFSIAATALFFSPDWPRRVVNRVRARLGAAEVPPPSDATASAPTGSGERWPRTTMTILGVYMAIQLLVPLRHWLYPGNVSWTEEGHNFSWRMMLRVKSATAEFFITEPARGTTWKIDPLEYLTRWQFRNMSKRPDMILQFCHHLAAEMRRQGHGRVEVRAHVAVSLNGREPQLLVNPRVDLAAQPRTILPARWIVPLTTPLPAAASSHHPAKDDFGRD